LATTSARAAEPISSNPPADSHLIRDRGEILMQAPRVVAKAPPQRGLGHNAPANLVADQPEARGATRDGFDQGRPFGPQVMVGEHMIAEPKRQAVNDDGLVFTHSVQCVDQVHGRLNRPPGVATVCPMSSNPLVHFIVEGLSRGDQHRSIAYRRRFRRPLGKGAFAGSRAAKDESDSHESSTLTVCDAAYRAAIASGSSKEDE
jgi:hypothetical protein